MGQDGMGYSFMLAVGVRIQSLGLPLSVSLFCMSPNPWTHLVNAYCVPGSPKHLVAILTPNYPVPPSCYSTSQLLHADLDPELCPCHSHI